MNMAFFFAGLDRISRNGPPCAGPRQRDLRHDYGGQVRFTTTPFMTGFPLRPNTHGFVGSDKKSTILFRSFYTATLTFQAYFLIAQIQGLYAPRWHHKILQ
jgi:hypothetical protein